MSGFKTVPAFSKKDTFSVWSRAEMALFFCWDNIVGRFCLASLYFVGMLSQNASLRAHNTFGIEETAACLLPIRSEAELLHALANPQLPRPFRVLGGGSNILLKGPVEGTVFKNEILGKALLPETEDAVLLLCGSGENWHETVLFAIENGLFGLENLALIPGTVGASPIQNIGAYGVEVKDHIHSVRFVFFETGKAVEYRAADCAFGYRDSIFKNSLRGQGMITAVTFRLSRTPNLQTSYGAIGEELQAAGILAPRPRDVAEAVMRIRQSKLPDPAVIGNAGSFFKNPVISTAHFEKLKGDFPQMPHYPAGEGKVKIPAGWLIEQRGWKGKTLGNAGVHARQALVLINATGAAAGAEIEV